MVKVVLTSGTAKQYTNGETAVEVTAKNVRQMVKALEAKYPGLGTEINTAMSVAIDGTILPDPYLEEVNEDSEIYVLPKIGGG
jgi:molybdopterin converting factor small subunit